MQTSTAAVIRTMRLALEYGGKSHPIHKMPFVLGRARECDLVLFGDAVSRRHAVLVEHQGEVVVEDLGSRNGLLVNARRVRGRLRVQSGDTLMLGNQSVIVTADRTAITLRPEQPLNMPEGRALAPLESTAPLESFALFTSAVDQALLRGRVADAERLFALHLGRPLEQGPRNRDPGPAVIEVVALVALRLAEAARNDAWLDFTLRVYASRNQPMPVAVVSGLCSLVAKLRGVNAMLLSSYLSAMSSRIPKLTAEQRTALDRLEGLQTVAMRSRAARRPEAPRTET